MHPEEHQFDCTSSKLFKHQIGFDLDSRSETIHIYGKDIDGSKMFLGALASRRRAFSCFGVTSPKRRNKAAALYSAFRVAVDIAFSIKPNIIRGVGREGKGDKYVCFGWRKNYLNSAVEEYAFKKAEENKAWVNQIIRNFLGKIETIGSQSIPLAERMAY